MTATKAALHFPWFIIDRFVQTVSLAALQSCTHALLPSASHLLRPSSHPLCLSQIAAPPSPQPPSPFHLPPPPLILSMLPPSFPHPVPNATPTPNLVPTSVRGQQMQLHYCVHCCQLQITGLLSAGVPDRYRAAQSMPQRRGPTQSILHWTLPESQRFGWTSSQWFMVA